MCIICNCGSGDGDDFLVTFESARIAMNQAKEAMLKCSKTATSEEAKDRYDATHKKMAKLIREWNKLEEFRESLK